MPKLARSPTEILEELFDTKVKVTNGECLESHF